MRLLQLLLLGCLIAGLSCTSEQSTTPKCSETAAPGSAESCFQFAVCTKGNPPVAADPHECCKDADGKAFEGDDLEQCLYGFGVGPAPTGSGGAGGTGTGGKGGAGTGGKGGGGGAGG